MVETDRASPKKKVDEARQSVLNLNALIGENLGVLDELMKKKRNGCNGKKLVLLKKKK